MAFAFNPFKAHDDGMGASAYAGEPVYSFDFVLRVEGIYVIPLKSVRSFTKKNEYEQIQEGGLNDYVHMRRKPVSSPHEFQVERYVTSSLTDPLANGAELILPVILTVFKHTSDTAAANAAKLYVFTGCKVTSKEYGGLDAEKSGLAVETITFAYNQLMVVPNIASMFAGGFNGSYGKTNNINPAKKKNTVQYLADGTKASDRVKGPKSQSVNPEDKRNTVQTFADGTTKEDRKEINDRISEDKAIKTLEETLSKTTDEDKKKEIEKAIENRKEKIKKDYQEEKKKKAEEDKNKEKETETEETQTEETQTEETNPEKTE